MYCQNGHIDVEFAVVISSLLETFYQAIFYPSFEALYYLETVNRKPLLTGLIAISNRFKPVRPIAVNWTPYSELSNVTAHFNTNVNTTRGCHYQMNLSLSVILGSRRLSLI